MRTYLLFSLAFSVFAVASNANDKPSETIVGCVSVRQILDNEISMSPDGRYVSYVLKTADVVANKNRYQLWVRDLRQAGERENGKMLFQADEVAGVTWLRDGRHVALMRRESNRTAVVLIDISTGKREVAVEYASNKMGEYSISASGNVVAFTTRVPDAEETRQKAAAARGYAFPFGYPFAHRVEQILPWGGRFEINVSRKNEAAKWVQKKISSYLPLQSSQAGAMTEGLDQLGYLSLSPDGSYLTFRYQVDDTPQGWQESRGVKWIKSMGFQPFVLGLYDLRTGQFRRAFDSPDVDSDRPANWSEDGRAFVIAGVSPVGSIWEKEDGENKTFPAIKRLFAVNIEDLSVSRVLGQSYRGKRVISWKQRSGKMLVLREDDALVWMTPVGRGWQEEGHLTIVAETSAENSIVTNGEVVVGITGDTETPSNLFLHDIRAQKTAVLTDLNPEIRHLSLGKVEKTEWINRYGAKATGFLVKPVGYSPANRYPLVIMTKGWGNRFICDGAGVHTMAFAPQPLANAGFLVLLANDPDSSQQPKEYPPAVGEAYNWMAMVESAVDLLEARGLAVRNNVGIIGFSRTSWKTDFMLTHSSFRFAAASSADSGILNYEAYWRYQWPQQSETEYGGPPYGKTFETWFKYAPAFNADKVQAPLLMEYVGFGIYSEPIDAYELFTALHQQNKPVELFFYPKGFHPLDTPFERVASLQRNVDWFRFWMQGQEGTAPNYDPDQYTRWHKLRTLLGPK